MWLETVILIETATAFWLSVLNVALLRRAVAETKSAARRAASVVLACVCGGQAMEALLFLWLGETSSPDGWSAAALLLVRTALATSAALMSLLLLRALSLRR